MGRGRVGVGRGSGPGLRWRRGIAVHRRGRRIILQCEKRRRGKRRARGEDEEERKKERKKERKVRNAYF